LTDLPIALSSPASAPVRHAQRSASQQTPAQTDAPQPDVNAFQDALALLLGSGLVSASPAGPGTGGAASKAGSSGLSDEDVQPVLDAAVTPTGLALPWIPTRPPADPLAADLVGQKKVIFSTAIADPVSPQSGAPTTPTTPTTPSIAALAIKIGGFTPTPSAPEQLGVIEAHVGERAGGQGLEEKLVGAPAAPSTAALAIKVDGFTPTSSVPEQPGVIEARVGERAWGQGLGEKLVWMVTQKHQVAELHLNPPDLGPLKISISLDQNQASAQFVSAHASVREAIELAMPRLREMLAESGITLGNTSVGNETFHEQAQRQPGAYVTQALARAADSGAVSISTRQLRPTHGLVDTFA
jgi:hypothetical protein